MVPPGRPGRRLAAGLLLVLALAGCGRGSVFPQRRPEPNDVAVARVGGQVVWTSDVRREAQAQGLIGEGEGLAPGSAAFRRVLDQVIDQRLLAEEAHRQGLDRDPVVRRRLQAAHDKLLGDVLVEAVVDRAVTDSAVRTLYQEQQRLAKTQEELHARQIVVASEPEADAIRRLLAAGANFETLATQRSADPATRFSGGDLGWFTLDAMPAPYQALKPAHPGDTIGPFRVDEGWAIVRVEERRPEKPISLETARPQIVRFLTYDEIRNLLAKLRGGAHVQILAPPPPSPAAPAAPAPRMQP